MTWRRIVLSAALSLVTAVPLAAQLLDEEENDASQPGSVLIFPKFLTGTVTVDGRTEPASSFEISVSCPEKETCAEHEPVKLRAHWVCPGGPSNLFHPTDNVCAERDFDLRTTIDGTLWFNPANVGTRAPANLTVTTPPCSKGYLIVWVINDLDEPIRFDGLIGDAILRHSNNSSGAYNAVPIQAAEHELLLHKDKTDLDKDGRLDFDGKEYLPVTGQIRGTVRYETSSRIQSFLTLLTLDVISNRPNDRTFVDLNFFSHDENLLSTSANFICWAEFRLSGIKPRTDAGSLSVKGLVESATAVDEWDHKKTLLGILETLEKSSTGGVIRETAYSLFTQGNKIDTEFEP
jgi:hypothetical protein